MNLLSDRLSNIEKRFANIEQRMMPFLLIAAQIKNNPQFMDFITTPQTAKHYDFPAPASFSGDVKDASTDK